MRYSEYMGDYSIDLEGEVHEIIEILKYLDGREAEETVKELDRQMKVVSELARDYKPEVIMEQIEKEMRTRQQGY